MRLRHRVMRRTRSGRRNLSHRHAFRLGAMLAIASCCSTICADAGDHPLRHALTAFLHAADKQVALRDGYAKLGQSNSMLHLVDSDLAMKKLRQRQPAQRASHWAREGALSHPSLQPVTQPVLAVPEPAVSAGHFRVQVPPGAKSGQLMEVTLPGMQTAVQFNLPQMAPGLLHLVHVVTMWSTQCLPWRRLWV